MTICFFKYWKVPLVTSYHPSIFCLYFTTLRWCFSPPVFHLTVTHDRSIRRSLRCRSRRCAEVFSVITSFIVFYIKSCFSIPCYRCHITVKSSWSTSASILGCTVVTMPVSLCVCVCNRERVRSQFYQCTVRGVVWLNFTVVRVSVFHLSFSSVFLCGSEWTGLIYWC